MSGRAARDSQAGQLAAGPTSPVKPSNVSAGTSRTIREDVEAGLASELYSRRSSSEDLVDAIFHRIISIDSAGDILRELLRVGILEVRRSDDESLSTLR